VYEPKEEAAAYAQIIVSTEQRDQIAAVWDAVAGFTKTELPELDPIIKTLRIGPGRDGKIEARFHGPDPQVLRGLAEQAKAIMRQDSEATDIRDDWRQAAKVIRPVFNEQVGRELGITRQDLAGALQSAFEGAQVGLYRDGIRLLPILLRPPPEEREDVTFIQDIQVYSPVLERSVTVGQVVNEFETVWANTVMRSRDRALTVVASCNPTGELTDALFARLQPQIEALTLPPGYTLTWGGEFEDSFEAQDALFKAIPAGFLFMIIATVLLFGKIRQPLIIWLTVPLAVIGITAGLLAFGAFDFMSLLGALSLIGLLIKNAIVLIEEMDQQIAAGDKDPMSAVLDSAVSRLRPVALAATTTILGMIPLLADVFFVNMSIVIMAGLGFATLLTLFYVPTLYCIFFRIGSKTMPTGIFAGECAS
jgi:multidrug efflux pump subunit AcrB